MFRASRPLFSTASKVASLGSYFKVIDGSGAAMVRNLGPKAGWICQPGNKERFAKNKRPLDVGGRFRGIVVLLNPAAARQRSTATRKGKFDCIITSKRRTQNRRSGIGVRFSANTCVMLDSRKKLFPPTDTPILKEALKGNEMLAEKWHPKLLM
eukprot:NODE_6555_length_632_cov_97.320792_g6532_i0.p1 GENE.NODE_6555_length_632_cov_97.320792_g6532_i0~~NODE_6555_length_632_cov_97.320792_g6532_i0.p1  ORF type:complete len:154 (-),score=5.45 NODE_6555_length_632_cov_97.320792_g6532_i0:107-568(-)